MPCVIEINVDPASGLVTGGQLAIAILVLLSYPLQCHPCRNSLFKVLYHGTQQTMDPRKFRIMTLSIMFGSWFVAISVSNLSTVLSLVGATGSTTICYILPGLFYDKLAKNMNRPDWYQFFGRLLAGWGLFVMAVSLGALAFGSSSGH